MDNTVGDCIDDRQYLDQEGVFGIVIEYIDRITSSSDPQDTFMLSEKVVKWTIEDRPENWDDDLICEVRGQTSDIQLIERIFCS